MKPWLRQTWKLAVRVALLVLVAVLAVAILFTVQYALLEPEENTLVQKTGATEGKVILSLSSAAVTVKTAPPGGPIRVVSNFDPDVFSLEQGYTEDVGGGWVYRLDFHERRTLHIAVVSIWAGKRSPEVLVELPRDLLFSLEAEMRGGYLMADLADMSLSTVDLELDRGVLGLAVSEPLAAPLERLSITSGKGTAFLKSLGNASPRELTVHHGIGAASIDLGGMWRQNAEVDLLMTLAKAEVLLPSEATVSGIDLEEVSKPQIQIVADTTGGSIDYTRR
jgi:hypothetical protein